MNDLVKHFSKNTDGRDFIVGDLHGCFDSLRQSLSDVNFNESTDRLFSVGDLVDRGTQSEESIDWIAKPWFHAVRGNHEQMAIEVFGGGWPEHNYISNGGKWFTRLPPERQKLFAQIFETLPITIEIDHQIGKIGIVHADCPYSDWHSFVNVLSSDESDESDNIIYEMSITEKAIWSRTRFQKQDTSNVKGVERIYVGHTPIKEWTILGNVYFIDTGCVFGGKLTLLEIK